MAFFKHKIREKRAHAGKCEDVHVTAETYRIGSNSISATVNQEDYATIVAKLQSAVCLNVAKRIACPAHDARLWSDMPSATRTPLSKWLKKIISFILSVIYIILPPFPTKIFRKIVFCYPQRGRYYYLFGKKNGKTKAVFQASEAAGMEHLSICLPQMIYPNVRAVDVFYHLLRCKVLTIPYHKKKSICVMELYCEQSIRWLHRDKNRKKIRSPNLIIFSQPNSSDLGCCLMMDPNFADIADFLQCDLLIFDYPGYGVSDGSPNEFNMYASIEAVVKYATDVLNYPTERIILIGFSLGTAVTVHVASMYKFAAVVLIAPFTSFFRIMCRRPYLTKPWFDMFPSLEKTSKITSPTLICHGQQDSIVSHDHGIRLHSNIADCELHLLKHASHQGIFCEREMWDKVEEFLGTRVGITRQWIEQLQNESSLSEVVEAIDSSMSY